MNEGLRRVSAASIVSQQAARRYGDVAAISRADAIRVAKRAAAAMGLKTAKLAMLDALFGFSKTVDWNAGSRPVVWPSNATLARRLSISISTAKHHLRGLVEAGLVAYADSPTFQRRGRRDVEGHIIESYGIDLSPITVRYDELAEIAAVAEEEAKQRQALSYRRTQLRRECEALLVGAAREQLDGPWNQLQARLDRLREVRATSVDVLTNLVDAYEATRDMAEEAYEEAFPGLNLDTALTKFRPLQTTAQESTSDNCKDERRDAKASQPSSLIAFGDEETSIDEKDVRASEVSQAQEVLPSAEMVDDVRHISLSLIRDACPEVGNFAPGVFASWGALKTNVDLLARLCSINPQVVDEARRYLGSDLAAVAMAVIFQKTAVNGVAKPGAYLRSLVKRGRAGELFLSRSLFAMQAACAKPPARLQ